MVQSLVTGGTGFVGRELVRQLVQRGDEVNVLDRVKPEAKVEWIKVDLCDKQALAGALAGRSYNVIYHTASLPGDTGDPEQMISVNIDALTHLLEFARETKVDRFVLTSSVSAYEWYPKTKFNPPDYLPVDEDHPCRPKDMYATTKRMQELLALTYYYEYQLPVTVLRLAAVIGPHGTGGGSFWRDFALQMKEGKRVQPPVKSANELSHYVDVRDVAEINIVAGQHPKAIGEIFHCCAAKATRGSEFEKEIKRLVPEAEVVLGCPWSMAQGGEVEFDMSKMKRLLEHIPRYSFRESLENIYEWAKSGDLD